MNYYIIHFESTADDKAYSVDKNRKLKSYADLDALKADANNLFTVDDDFLNESRNDAVSTLIAKCLWQPPTGTDLSVFENLAILQTDSSEIITNEKLNLLSGSKYRDLSLDDLVSIGISRKRYLHLGNPGLQETAEADSGLFDGETGTTPGRPSVSGGSAAGTFGDPIILRFNTTLATVNLVDGQAVVKADGSIDLPVGLWLLCASCNIVDAASAGGQHRTIGVLSIFQGTNNRHSQTVYMRNGEWVASTEDAVGAGFVSVTGAVVVSGDANKNVSIQVKLLSQVASDEAKVYSAHLHAYKI